MYVCACACVCSFVRVCVRVRTLPLGIGQFLREKREERDRKGASSARYLSLRGPIKRKGSEKRGGGISLQEKADNERSRSLRVNHGVERDRNRCQEAERQQARSESG